MPYTEIRNGIIRVRWKLANGKYSGGAAINEETGEPFADEDEAKQYGRDKEGAIRLGLVQAKSPSMTFGAWARVFYAGLRLEPTTMRNYRSLLEGHLFKAFEHRTLDSFVAEEMDPWEQSVVRAGYSVRTAADARSLLINILGEAVPRHLDYNPAVRRRGKGRKGLKRIERAERSAKAWPTPLQAILIAERAAMLAGHADVFLMLVTKAWTGMRWSELLALRPDSLLTSGRLDIDRKLYELSGFYWSHPKDGSVRELHLPPFLLSLLKEQAERADWCTCKGRRADLPPVEGEEFVEWCSHQSRLLFLTPKKAHYRRGDFAGRVMRPAADGRLPGHRGARARAPRPVTAQVGGGDWAEGPGAFPGIPLNPAWPYAATPKGVQWPYPPLPDEFEIPSRKGHWGYNPKDEKRRHLVSWLPVLSDLTAHGLRHGHQTWMDDGGIKKALKIKRMGHEDTTMPGLYGHVTDGMIRELCELLQGLWENAVAERFKIHPRSPVPVLDGALAAWREGTADKIVSQISPKQQRGRLSG